MTEKNQDSDYLPGFVTEFIQRLIRKMGYRRRVRREVKQELIDHFSDALAECNGEQEKRNLAQDLIAEFGDAGLLAKLNRRAKKRCRPLWRKALFRTGQAAIGLYLLSCLGNAWVIYAWRSDDTDYLGMLNRLGVCRVICGIYGRYCHYLSLKTLTKQTETG